MRCLILLASLLLLDACAQNPSATQDGTVDSRVYTIDATPGVDVELEADRLVFQRFGHEDLLERRPGDILVSGRGSGFLRTVAAAPAQTTASEILVLTTDTQLGDAVIEGNVTDSSDLSDVSGKWDAPGKADGILPFKGSLEIGAVSLPSEPGVSVSIEKASIVFTPDVHLGLSVQDRRVSHFDAIASGDLDASFAVRFEVSGNKVFYPRKELWRSTPKPLVQMVGFVPIVETVELAFGVGADVEIDGAASIEAGGDLEAYVSAGAIYESGDWSAVGERSIQVFPIPSSVKAEGTIDVVAAFAYVELAIKFYGVVGPFIELDTYVGLDSDRNWQATSLGLRGEWGGEVGIFGYDIAAYKKQLFDVKKPL